jgi:hypothetical protein
MIDEHRRDGASGLGPKQCLGGMESLVNNDPPGHIVFCFFFMTTVGDITDETAGKDNLLAPHIVVGSVSGSLGAHKKATDPRIGNCDG